MITENVLIKEIENVKNYINDADKRHSKLPIYYVSECFLVYEEWFAKFEDEINIELSENGADREMDFDCEREFDKRYEMYLNAR